MTVFGLRARPSMRASISPEVGQVIREMRADSHPREIIEITGDWVVCVGVDSGRRTTLSRSRLHSYIVVSVPE